MNNRRIQFTPSARSQFLEGIAYIQKENPDAAKRFRNKVEIKLKQLIDYPDSGRVVLEFPDLPFRELLISPYRFFYKLKDDTIWIVAVWHHSQEIENPK